MITLNAVVLLQSLTAPGADCSYLLTNSFVKGLRAALPFEKTPYICAVLGKHFFSQQIKNQQFSMMFLNFLLQNH